MKPLLFAMVTAIGLLVPAVNASADHIYQNVESGVSVAIRRSRPYFYRPYFRQYYGRPRYGPRYYYEYPYGRTYYYPHGEYYYSYPAPGIYFSW